MVSHRFTLIRAVDVSGVSGVGSVAEGVEFSDGTVVMRWLPITGCPQTTVMHPDIASVRTLHGHDGATRIEWVDKVELPVQPTAQQRNAQDRHAEVTPSRPPTQSQAGTT